MGQPQPVVVESFSGGWGVAGYAGGMHTPWELIIAMFTYAIVGWGVLYLIHRTVAARRDEPRNATEAAKGYGESWNNSRSADL
jgi:SNF family Na+-dependent transporter